jgi:peptidoglycan-N-acetylglucosamine deacetylase
MIPYRTPFILPLIYPSLTWRMASDQNDLYLTFDDGPVPGPTEFVLETLAKTSVKATFFCIGDNIRKHPQLFASIIAGGHAVGNHTVNHLNGWRTNSKAYLENVRLFDDIAQQAGLQTPTRLFRPPYGQISRTQIRLLSGYQVIMWDALSQDYNKNISLQSCLKSTIGATRPGSIILFHDSYKAQRNMEYALPRLIDHFGERGFCFKTITSRQTKAKTA